jgi:ribose 5-phosphate isomerase A
MGAMVGEPGAEALKQAAARRSAEWIRDGMKLGLGTGSTVRFLLEEIAERRGRGDWKGVIGVPTSTDTERRARELGIPLGTLDEHPRLDLTIDGADEVDPSLDLIKGLGGALLREKIVATASERVVIVIDAAKSVDRLGTRAPLPVEVDPFGHTVHVAFFKELGGDPELRTSGGEPVVTDGGNLVYDVRFAGGIADPAGTGARLDARPGVVENGLFLGIATAVVVADASGTRVLERR